MGWAIRQLEKSGVAIELGAGVDSASIGDEFDEIAVATGAKWQAPALAGQQRAASVLEIADWLRDDDERVGKTVLIVGQGKAAISLARLCATRGRLVTVTGADSVFAPEVGGPGRFELVAQLQQVGVRLLGGATIDAVEGATVSLTVGDASELVEAETIVITTGFAPDLTLASALEAAGKRVHSVGDCREIGFIEGATRSALEVARLVGSEA
jgi:2,4-dienoyl-CoA reductase (NADPH2)